VHPITLSRFGLYSALDFVEAIGRIQDSLREHVAANAIQYWGLNRLSVPSLLSFDVLKKAFKSRIALAPDNTLDKETRRAWTALKWCLEQYAAICTGGEFWYGRRTQGGIRFRLFMGDSNTAEAWTDGASYIAIDRKQVLSLKTKPMETAMKIFSLVEHEISHQGDSLSCGHDEVFYQRFHDLVLEHAAVRQKFLYIWLKKYTSSMENAGKKPSGVAWRERLLQERMGNGRVKNGLGKGLVSSEDAMLRLALEVSMPVESDTDMQWINAENLRLINAGLCPPPPAWEILVRDSEKQLAEDRNGARAKDLEGRLEGDSWAEMIAQDDARDRQWYADVLGIQPEELPDAAFNWYQIVVEPHYGDPELIAKREDLIRSAWYGDSDRFKIPKPWEHTTKKSENSAACYAAWFALPEALFDAPAVEWLDQHSEFPNDCLKMAIDQKLWEKPVAEQNLIIDQCMQGIMAKMDADVRHDEEWDEWVREQEAAAIEKTERAERIPEDLIPYVQDGETRWTIEHNASAAGFLDILDYLQWRENQ
ncbi:hypothetical protein HAP94_06115, partial [Acidithiobacillus ferrivorans]|nr:hypothetical protein [Acidithiobacillus ferrivorans]